MQKGHKGFSIFKERVLGMRGDYQDRPWRDQEGRRDLLEGRMVYKIFPVRNYGTVMNWRL
ncbi:MAG TPA: hypothetical protein VGQ03_02440 [Nitrososphaera sp.]|jgi:hypothetical protein|nr:hypothetical protein [Nitrososphaera sp.]